MDSLSLLDATVRRLRRLEKKCFAKRRNKRFRFYTYLSEVFAYYELLERSGELLTVRDALLEKPSCKSKCGDPIRVLIDATSRADAKAKSRWTRALQYAIDKRPAWKPSMTLKQFIRANGGVAGCAAKIAVRRPRWWKKKGEVLRDWK